MLTGYKKHRELICLISSVIIVLVSALPYFLLGEGAYVQLHDQMDGEILNYIYQAKYLGIGSIIPEFMNGMMKAAMLPPAPFGVIFYKLFTPFGAYTYMLVFILSIGSSSMFLLCKKFAIIPEICAIIAILFCYMPFYPTYGLAALGQPLLVLAFLQLYENKYKILSYAMIFMYAGFSSLTLIGYVWIVFGFLMLCILCIKKRKVATAFSGWCVLVFTYITTNISLIAQVINPKAEQSHRVEMALHPVTSIGSSFRQLFFVGGSYSNVYSIAIFLFFVVVSFFVLFFFRKHKKIVKDYKAVSVLILAIAVLTGLSVLWNVSFIQSQRENLGGFIKYFQADRVYWVFPFLWCIVLAILLKIAYEITQINVNSFVKFLIIVGSMGLCCIQGIQIFRDCTFNKNIRLLLVDGYEQITWESFYMPEVFSKISQAIPDQNGYSVVSLGMYPSIALYNGYTCADGYSNNYLLSYKHDFRKIIEKELEQNEAMRIYYDDWGNRVYLVESERGFYPIVSKGEKASYSNIEFNFDAMKELGIKYIFAAGEILDETTDLKLVEGSPFSSKSSYYEVWVYELGARE